MTMNLRIYSLIFSRLQPTIVSTKMKAYDVDVSSKCMYNRTTTTNIEETEKKAKSRYFLFIVGISILFTFPSSSSVFLIAQVFHINIVLSWCFMCIAGRRRHLCHAPCACVCVYVLDRTTVMMMIYTVLFLL